MKNRLNPSHSIQHARHSPRHYVPKQHGNLASRLGLLAALLAAFGVRLIALGGESLWYDETVSVVLARASIREMLAHTARDIHPPGYYLVLHGWQALAQPSLRHGLEFLFAWPSLLFGVTIVALLYPIGRRLLDRPTALLAVWIAALHPQHVWYSQEVRMYTLGALLGLLCLWLLLRYRASSTRSAAVGLLCGYALCAALGLYTLYYFLFLLLALNLIALFVLWTGEMQTIRSRVHRLGGWLAAQVGVLLLWLPWLPIFWRQATEPPVPDWRVPWRTPGELLAALAESARVLFMGESFPDAFSPLWLVLAGLLLYAHYRYAQRSRRTMSIDAFWVPLLVVFLPLALIVTASLAVTPLYHVRYLFTYAPLFALILAAGVRQLVSQRNTAWITTGWTAALLLVLAGGWSLYRFWTAPLYRADDHRTAVAQLAQAWRPGDAILVNAGWVYTVLETYWPSEPEPNGAVPPAVANQQRLSLYANAEGVALPPAAAPIVVRSGSVDGPASLGWGDSASDFYAIETSATERALTQMAETYPRIWQYRLYDTVNDPRGVIRSTLATVAEQAADTGYAGRDFLRVQRFDTGAPAPIFAATHADEVRFGETVAISHHVAPETVGAGSMLYIDLYWDLYWSPGAQPPADGELQTSLRLYRTSGDAPAVQWTQVDAPLAPSSGGIDSGSIDSGDVVRTPLALPVPLSTAPGTYSLELILYRAGDGVPLALPEHERTVGGQRWRLQTVQIEPGAAIAPAGEPIATFDYISLLNAALDRPTAAPGESLAVSLLWYPGANAYRDTYDAVLELRAPDGQVAQSWVERAGGAAYPSGDWLPQRPVRDVKTLPLAADLPPGPYTLMLRLRRASDGLPVPARTGWLGSEELVTIGSLLLE